MSNVTEPQQPSEEEIKAFAASVEPDEVVEDTPDEQPEKESKLPAKFRGKSIEDVISMYQEAEKVIGRQGQEVKQVRDLADQLLKRDLSKAETHAAEKEEDPIDYFTDPAKAVERAVANHPKLKQAEERLSQMARQQALENLHKSHPDMQEILQDPEFTEYVQGSRVRQELYNRADKSYDYESADELISGFKVRKAQAKKIVEDAAEEVKSEASKAVKKATVSSGSASTGGKRVYNRAELLEWRLRNPAKYMAMQDEITQAYIDGRVR